jgi:hypothetical protein
MKENKEFETIGELIAEPVTGYVIMHQESALGNDFRDDDDAYDGAQARLKEHALKVKDELQNILGTPSKESIGWNIGVPTWASGGGYALWNRDVDFLSVFISWDNPEDPSFVIVGRAPLCEFSNDHMNPSPDPWGEGWMFKGVW